jgi:glycosyltransferase involved in cell wall biosynthesis
MRVLIANAQVPFVRGGAEILAEGLQEALRLAGHDCDVVRFPFKWYPAPAIPPQVLAARLMDLSSYSGLTVDLVIGLKFPAYLIPHPCKSMWIVHQHRAAYDFWDAGRSDLIDGEGGRCVRDFIREMDSRFIPEARRVFTISRNVSQRLSQFNSIASQPLYHPPASAGQYRSGPYGDYVLFPSRLDPLKRQWLVIDALSTCAAPVRIVFVGGADNPTTLDELRARVTRNRVEERVTWTGAVSEAEKLRLYSGACAVIYPALDEDYGYVTLEAMLAARPVITCTDSGGPLEFVQHECNGLVVEPTKAALAGAMDRLWNDRELGRRLGGHGRACYDELGISWSRVVDRLTEAA